MAQNTTATKSNLPQKGGGRKYKFPGIPVTCDGSQLVAGYVEAFVCDGGVFYPITPSTGMGEAFEYSVARGELNAFGQSKLAIEAEGEHAAQGGSIALSVTGKRVVNFTSGQGIVYGLEQYYHAPGKLSTMVVELGARALTKHALNVHCGHDDVYAALDTGWIILFGMDAQQGADQAIILRRVAEETLTPGINVTDGFLTTHSERHFLRPETELIREFLGRPEDIIDTPTEAQKVLFGPKRRRVPRMMDLEHPILLGPVQNQEHYMTGVAARRNHFAEEILPRLEAAFKDFGDLTGRHYGLVSEYNCEFAETVFISLGSAAENIHAVIDHLQESRKEIVGGIHVNVIRPFPEAAVINAIRGKKNIIILERCDDQLAGENALCRDIRSAIGKALENNRTNAHKNLPALQEKEVPRIFAGVYGLGSRDFRPEHIIGAYDYALGRVKRKDGKSEADGEHFFYLGVDHDYAVCSKETPSCLPKGAISVRFHSIGGWGMITTGKNLGGIIGSFSKYIAERDNVLHPVTGGIGEAIDISANPKYGSEKKGAPTNYFLVAAADKIRTNCDLKHVNVVLCCDPKAFTHCNPLEGMVEGGVFVWESEEDDPAKVWQRIPKIYRKEIVAKNIRLYTLKGFEIAKKATDREDLQLRMQGNAFLGAFFGVSSFLDEFKIPRQEFLDQVRAQYDKKFGRFGEDVVKSNMMVMEDGFQTVRQISYGQYEAEDRSSMRGETILPLPEMASSCGACPTKAPMFTMAAFDKEYRSDYGYDQPSSPLASVGVMAAATGATSSKYVARRETPVFIAENCTQCMECISACPDTALPNTAQDISTILNTAFRGYVKDKATRDVLLKSVPAIDKAIRPKMAAASDAKDTGVTFYGLISEELDKLCENGSGLKKENLASVKAMIKTLPMAFTKVAAIFRSAEKKKEGEGGIFSIFVSDLCKGCGECVERCGDHEALKMVPETEDVNGKHQTATEFFKLLPDTKQKYLGLYDESAPQDSRAATLRNHLMQRSKYEALVSGDGACAGCGEKTILRAIATITEAYMRPLFHKKSERLREKVKALRANGLKQFEALKASDETSYNILRRTILHLILGFGGESLKVTEARIKAGFTGGDKDLIEALCAVMEHDAFNHRELQVLDGKTPDGMSVMAMAAHTGCNTVYGSTPPSNPHPYPWMNSLFQDGATIGWIIGESFILDHARRSVMPERFATTILGGGESRVTEEDYFMYTHFSDMQMTAQEVRELPKVWVVGGDGGMGDIGFQNVSKAILQNRPNVKMVMLDTQVYSNTGGQNSDSSPMTGGQDMNQFGAATQGKMVEKKGVAEVWLGGHGSPFVAQVSAANSATLFKAILDGLEYRGTCFIQSFTTCQPEHGVADYASTLQAKMVRDSRGLPEFVFNPQSGETYQESFSLQGNPDLGRDWRRMPMPEDRKKTYAYTVAHWAITEKRFRQHFKKVKAEQLPQLISIEDILPRLTQDDVIHRHFLNKNHRAYVPDFQVYIMDIDPESGKVSYHTISRQAVLFCVERRKSWRFLQSRAGIQNEDYLAQKALLKDYDEGKIAKEDFFSSKIQELLDARKPAPVKR